jgi:hypothetical protein
MKCDGCGRQFPGQEAVQDTRAETIGKGSIGPIPITLCRQCSSSRRNNLWYLIAFFFWLFFGLFFIGPVAWLLNLLQH